MYVKDCVGCGTSFETWNLRKIRCEKNCHRESKNGARHQRSVAHDIEFIAVDGEGVTRDDGRHEYVLLSVGEESLYNRDGSALHWTDIFEFLYDQFREFPRAAFVGFYLNYDFTQWLRSLPEDRARMLFTKDGVAARQRRASGGNPTPFPVYVDHDRQAIRWEVDLLGTKRFRLRPAKVPAVPWLYVCDTGGFWQTSFLNAINPAGWRDRPVCTPEQWAIIEEGKAQRATALFDRAMIRYNVAENRVLSSLMSRLNEGFVSAGIRLSKDQWFGPGQVASAWLKGIGAPSGEEVRAAVPEEYLDAARQTYYGGWFEIQAHGHIPGTTHEYDINSAYPAVIAELPCLLHGTWTAGTGSRPLDRYTMVRAEMFGSSARSGVAPHRLPSGAILRPGHSIGWIWADELFEAHAAGLVDRFEILEWVDYDPCDCPPPMRDIASLYNRRLEVGKNTVEGKALKLVYNSAYGKFAQSVGSPRYANAVYASLITSGCRSKILSSIATHPTGADSLVMVATDGVYFRDPHSNLEMDPNRLGAWDHSEKENLTLLMPGVYWDDKARERIADGQAPQFKARGISARDLATRIHDLDDQFAAFDGVNWPTLELSVGFSMVSCKQALHRNDWTLAGQVTAGDSRTISSAPEHKRVARSARRDGDVWRTRPWATLTSSPESTPYSETFGAPIDGRDALDGISPDAGTAEQAWWWAIHET